MKRLPYFQALTSQFPWARVESDGTTYHPLVAARFNVYGSGLEFGHWSVPGGARAHDEFYPNEHFAKVLAPWKGVLTDYKKGYQHGQVMLETEWPTDVQSWKIDEDLIPRLFFDDERLPPAQNTSGLVTDWKSWHEWRGLPLRSPAALLMTYPMTVYQLLTATLGVVNLRDLQDSNGPRRKLKIHYIGAEVELNSVPLYGLLSPIQLPFYLEI